MDGDLALKILRSSFHRFGSVLNGVKLFVHLTVFYRVGRFGVDSAVF